MKKLITILVLSSAMLSACEGDPEFVPKTSVEAKIHELMIGYDGKIDSGTAVVKLSAAVSDDVLKKAVEDQDYEVTDIR